MATNTFGLNPAASPSSSMMSAPSVTSPAPKPQTTTMNTASVGGATPTASPAPKPQASGTYGPGITPPPPPNPFAPVPMAPTPQTSQGTTATSTGATSAPAAGVPTTSTADTTNVQDRLTGIINQNSDLSQLARTQSDQQMQGRGLVNSSMAVGAGENAVIQNALPIAQQDAQAANSNAQFNAGQNNAVGEFNAGQTNDVNKYNAGNQQQNDQFNAGNQQQNSQFNANQQNQALLANMDETTRQNIENTTANYQTLIQGNQSAASLYQQTLLNISNIQNNKDLTGAAKDAAIAQQQQYMLQGMDLIGGMDNIDMGGLLNFGDTIQQQGSDTAVTPSASPAPAPVSGGGIVNGNGGYNDNGGGYGTSNQR